MKFSELEKTNQCLLNLRPNDMARQKPEQGLFCGSCGRCALHWGLVGVRVVVGHGRDGGRREVQDGGSGAAAEIQRVLRKRRSAALIDPPWLP